MESGTKPATNRLAWGFLLGIAVGLLNDGVIFLLDFETFDSRKLIARMLIAALAGLLVSAAVPASFSWPWTLFRSWILGMLVTVVAVISGGYPDHRPVLFASYTPGAMIVAAILKSWPRQFGSSE